MSMEKTYYAFAAKSGLQRCCSSCGVDDPSVMAPRSMLDKLKNLKGMNVYPICVDCVNKGKPPVTHGKLTSTGNARGRKRGQGRAAQAAANLTDDDDTSNDSDDISDCTDTVPVAKKIPAKTPATHSTKKKKEKKKKTFEIAPFFFSKKKKNEVRRVTIDLSTEYINNVLDLVAAGVDFCSDESDSDVMLTGTKAGKDIGSLTYGSNKRDSNYELADKGASFVTADEVKTSDGVNKQIRKWGGRVYVARGAGWCGWVSVAASLSIHVQDLRGRIAQAYQNSDTVRQLWSCIAKGDHFTSTSNKRRLTTFEKQSSMPSIKTVEEFIAACQERGKRLDAEAAITDFDKPISCTGRDWMNDYDMKMIAVEIGKRLICLVPRHDEGASIMFSPSWGRSFESVEWTDETVGAEDMCVIWNATNHFNGVKLRGSNSLSTAALGSDAPDDHGGSDARKAALRKRKQDSVTASLGKSGGNKQQKKGSEGSADPDLETHIGKGKEGGENDGESNNDADEIGREDNECDKDDVEEEDKQEADEVEAFVGHTGKGANLKLRVRWKGWSSSDDTNELRTSLVQDMGEAMVKRLETKMERVEKGKAAAKAARERSAVQNKYARTYGGQGGSSKRRKGL